MCYSKCIAQGGLDGTCPRMFSISSNPLVECITWCRQVIIASVPFLRLLFGCHTDPSSFGASTRAHPLVENFSFVLNNTFDPCAPSGGRSRHSRSPGLVLYALPYRNRNAVHKTSPRSVDRSDSWMRRVTVICINYRAFPCAPETATLRRRGTSYLVLWIDPMLSKVQGRTEIFPVGATEVIV